MTSNHVKFTLLAPILEVVNRRIPGRPHRLLSGRAADLAPAAVLEVCAGTGYVARLVAAQLTHCRVTALDVSAESLGLGRALAARARLNNLVFVEADASAMPFDDGSFDCVVSCFGLHEIPSDVRRDALTEIRRVLRPGGRLLVVDLERPTTWWRPIWDLAVRLGEKPDARDVLGTGLRDALTAARFTDVTRTGFTSERPFQVVEAVSA